VTSAIIMVTSLNKKVIRGSVVVTETRRRVGRLKNVGSIPDRARRSLTSAKRLHRLWRPFNLLLNYYRWLFLGGGG